MIDDPPQRGIAILGVCGWTPVGVELARPPAHPPPAGLCKNIEKIDKNHGIWYEPGSGVSVWAQTLSKCSHGLHEPPGTPPDPQNHKNLRKSANFRFWEVLKVLRGSRGFMEAVATF